MSDIDVTALAHPLEFPDAFKTWITDYVATHVPKLPISQVFGFQLQRIRTATTDASETRATNSYGDLATVGPSLTNLADGWYILAFGADVAQSVTAGNPQMSPEINGVAATDADACSLFTFYPSPARSTAIRLLMVHLVNGGTNSIVMKYKSTSGTATFELRFLHAIKVQTLDNV